MVPMDAWKPACATLSASCLGRLTQELAARRLDSRCGLFDPCDRVGERSLLRHDVAPDLGGECSTSPRHGLIQSRHLSLRSRQRMGAIIRLTPAWTKSSQDEHKGTPHAHEG